MYKILHIPTGDVYGESYLSKEEALETLHGTYQLQDRFFTGLSTFLRRRTNMKVAFNDFIVNLKL